MSDFKEYKPMDVEHNVKAAVENLRKAYWSNDTEKVAKIFTEAEGIIVSAICHDTYTVCKPDEEKPQGDLISREALKKEVENLVAGGAEGLKDYYENGSKSDENSWIGGVYDTWELINSAPPVEEPERPQGEFTRKELESWLYRIAGNNLENELGRSCEEIINRLDGFERFVSDMRKGGAE